MANATVTAWLIQPQKDYQTGVALYGQFGTSGLLKTFFSKGKGAYHLTRLIETLTKLNLELSNIPVQFVAPVEALPAKDLSRPRIYSLTDVEWDAAPDEIKDLYTENTRLKSHAELLFHQIRITGTAQDRLAMALQLLDDRDKRSENFKAIKEFQETGKVKEKIVQDAGKTIDQLTMAEIAAVLKNFPTYISKDKARMDAMADGPKKDKVISRLLEREIFLKLAKERVTGL